MREAFATNIDKIIANYVKEPDLKSLLDNVSLQQANNGTNSTGRDKGAKHFMF